MNNKILYLSHGGGPLPLLGDAAHLEMCETLEHLAKHIGKPDGIVVISAHWETRSATILNNPKPALYYDYSGFPEASYHIQYPCPGSPKLAKDIQKHLNRSGIKSEMEANRGLDHGVFVPLKIMYPEADIPCVQLSLLSSLSAQAHLEMARL